MMQRDQLSGNQAAQFRAGLNVVGFRDTAVQCTPAQSASVLFEAPDQPRKFSELLVAREAAAQFQSLAGRKPAALPKFEAEVMTILGNSIDLVRQLCAAELKPLDLVVVAVMELFLEDAGLLVESGLCDLGRPRCR